MNAKELERFLASRGGNASAIDVVVRRLRDAFKVSTGGRGLNAHKLDVDEIAWIIASYAGSETAARAGETLARLSELRPPAFRQAHTGFDFLTTLQMALRNGADDIREVRIGRNINTASVVLEDGTEEHFVDPENPGNVELGATAFRSEGILSGGLLRDLTAELSNQ